MAMVFVILFRMGVNNMLLKFSPPNPKFPKKHLDLLLLKQKTPIFAPYIQTTS